MREGQCGMNTTHTHSIFIVFLREKIKDKYKKKKQERKEDQR